MDITPIDDHSVIEKHLSNEIEVEEFNVSFIKPQKIISENSVVGCDSSGKPVDNLGRVFSYDPCPFGQTYNCSSSSCKYSSWFLFVAFGLPFLAIAILIIAASVTSM